MAPKTGSKKLVETWRPERDLDVQETKWDAEREKACINTYAHASASQICLQNLCGQQQNSPMADQTPLLGPNLDPKTGPKQRPKRRNENVI